MDVVAEVGKIINIPKKDLIARGMLAFIAFEISDFDVCETEFRNREK